MKKYFLVLAIVSLLGAYALTGWNTSAQQGSISVPDSPTVSTTLVLSQVYGGGGAGSGSPTYLNDYVEIKNISATTQSLNGLSLYYGSATGNFASTATNAFALPNVTLNPGQYYFVQLGSPGTVGGTYPVTPDATTTNLNLSASSGKVGLVNAAALPINSCGASATPCTTAQLAAFVDWVAYGAAGNGTAGNGEGGTSVNNGTAITNTQGAVRKALGCTDTDNNNGDFDVVTGPVPRNSSSTATPCSGGGGGSLLASMAANPSTVVPGGSILLTVTVTPATSPPSTGITVVGNISTIGGASSQTFYDDGTNGDVTAGDNTFSYLATIPPNFAAGTYSVSAVASDAQARTASPATNVTVSGAIRNEDPLLFGNPTNATADIANENNYLMVRPQYTLSYNRSKATPNWVAWRLDITWLGSAPRQDDYRADTSLPAGWYEVQAGDYSGSGYDRGHMCPSADRTDTIPDNSATFLMTNFVPQLPDNNQGPWEDFENYCRTLAQAGNEVYIVDGPWGNIGTVAGGKVVVPQWTWKVVLVLPNGSNDLQRLSKSARMFGVIMSNQAITRSAPWRNFRVTVDQVETLTGYDFFSNIPKNTQELLERRHDTQ
jgi:endonuclease G